MLGYIFTLWLIVLTLAALLLGFGAAQVVAMQYVFFGLLVVWFLVVVLINVTMRSLPKKSR